ncbi:serine hydrolase [Flagellimonas sp.]|uniref:serine hydrolase n=1 Tax=Flagellimonas sp. TaxID=2058762 RepID=UPI003B506DE1
MAKTTTKIQRPRKYILVSILLIGLNFSIGQTKDQRLDDLEQDIEALMKSYNAVGLSVSVVEKDEIIFSRGFGYRDLGKKLPVNENTSFPIASCSKAFTASLLGILSSQRKISLKDRPTLHIPKLQFYNSEMDSSINIEDLLSHKSGLGNLNGTLVLFPEKANLNVIEKLKHIKPEGATKDSWIYSNMGYTLAGIIVEQVTNRSWEENITESILSPLQMTSSFVDLESMKMNNNYSYGYGLSNGDVKKVLFENYHNYKAAGGIRSSARDMGNWMITWLNNGKFNGNQILPGEFVKNATAIHNIRPGMNEPGAFLFGDGFGWRMESNNGNYKVYHGGNTSGFSSLVLTYPFKKLGITVLTNQTNSILPYIIADIIKNRMLNLNRTEINDYPIRVDDVYTIGQINNGLNPENKPTHALSDFEGRYTHKGYGSIVIEHKDGRLFAIFPIYKFFLEHLYHDVFVMKPTTEISQVMNPEFAMNFKTDNNGEIESFTMNLQSEPVEFIKQLEK